MLAVLLEMLDVQALLDVLEVLSVPVVVQGPDGLVPPMVNVMLVALY